VRDDVMMHHGRSGIPNAATSQNPDLAIASGRLNTHATTQAEITDVEPSVQENWTLGVLTQGFSEFRRGFPAGKGIPSIEPANIQNVRLRYSVRIRG
jgi:hypothetical protein